MEQLAKVLVNIVHGQKTQEKVTELRKTMIIHVHEEVQLSTHQPHYNAMYKSTQTS